MFIVNELDLKLTVALAMTLGDTNCYSRIAIVVCTKKMPFSMISIMGSVKFVSYIVWGMGGEPVKIQGLGLGIY